MTYDEFLIETSSLIAAIDQKISEQLSVIMQHEKFRELESIWTSLKQLVDTKGTHTSIRIRILDMSWREISEDLNLSYDIQRTSLYQRIYSRELNTAGGLPFGMILVCHRLSVDGSSGVYEDLSDFDDIYTAQLLGDLGDRCLCQILVGIDEKFFGDAPDIIFSDTERLRRIVESDDFRPWQNLRKASGARFLNIVMPDYLLRRPYCDYQSSFIFTETSNDSSACLWGNAIFLLAMNVVREFIRVSWFGFLRACDEREHTGAIVELPNGEPAVPKILLPAENDSDWADFGLTVLSSLYLSDYPGFFSNSSVITCHNDNERMTGMMQTNLMAMRFSHYVKVMLRDRVGSYDTPDECKKFLSSWLSKYVMNSIFHDESVMARYPLKSYDIKVVPRRDDQTIYDCELKLEPQYQYDLTTAVIVLSASVRNNAAKDNSNEEEKS